MNNSRAATSLRLSPLAALKEAAAAAAAAMALKGIPPVFGGRGKGRGSPMVKGAGGGGGGKGIS